MEAQAAVEPKAEQESKADKRLPSWSRFAATASCTTVRSATTATATIATIA